MNKQWFDQVAQSALCDPETLEATYDIATALIRREIVGDFVECGVYAGAQCAIMAAAIRRYTAYGTEAERECALNKRIHLFDSFAGIPPHGPNDIEFRESGYKGGESACSRAQVEANMKAWSIPSELLVYHEGLFDLTIPEYCLSRVTDFGPPWKIALLRLDGDLYESTRTCVDFLLPRVWRGGWVIIDDLNLSGCRQALFEKIIPAPCYFRIPCK